MRSVRSTATTCTASRFTGKPIQRRNVYRLDNAISPRKY
jgi:hypothetical protein